MPTTPSEISYAWSARSRIGRWVIRAIETLCGRPRLIRMAKDYDREVATGRDFWEVMQERYRIDIDTDGTLERIPDSGPTVVVANHPYGILDGLAMGRLMSMRRKDFKIVAHTVFTRAPELQEHILPVSFDETKEATALNLKTRREAIAHLEAGGAIAIFPGGCVSTAPDPFGQPIDPRWKNFTAKMAARPGVRVVPMFFEGRNSRLFQAISHVSQTLRYGLLLREFGRRVGGSVTVKIGNPIEEPEISARRTDPTALMDYLRSTVYMLAPHPIDTMSYGWNGERRSISG